MRGVNVPTFVIVLCFIFGAWPIGVALAILKAINSDYKKQQKRQHDRMEYRANQGQPTGNAWWTNASSGTTYTTGSNGGNSTGDMSGSTVNGVYDRATNYRTPGAEQGPNGTTYHYSYVKKNGETTDARAPGSKTPFSSVPQGNFGASASVPQVRTKGHKRSAATVLSTVFMSISLGVSALLFFVAAACVGAFGLPDAYGNIIAAMISSSITAVLYLFRQFYKSRDYRIMSYLSALHGERYYSIAKLADIADVSSRRVIRDLQYMQAKGVLPNEAVIDRRLGYLILYKSARAEAEADSRVGSPVPKPSESARPKTAEEIASEMSEHEKILHRIRELNDDIDNEIVSEKIDEIETLTRKIFKLVEEKPEMEGQLDMFLSYYLPTTLKLLNSYAYFEEQGIRGENIDAGMRNIEETLDMLIDGYKTQLDKLFESDTLDVTTDINVLEQMMKADGFTRESDFGGGTATATMPENKTEVE